MYGFHLGSNSRGDATTTSAESAEDPALPGMMSPEVATRGTNGWKMLEVYQDVPGCTPKF